MTPSDEDAFIDSLYAAAAEPALWEGAIARFVDLVGGNGGFLSRLDVASGVGEAIVARIDPEGPRLFADYYGAINPLTRVADPLRYRAEWRPIILTDEDWLPKAELLRTEYYNDFMRRFDSHAVLMVRLALIGSEVCVLNVNRPSTRGPFERQDLEAARRLHPHLIRAFGLSEAMAAVSGLRDGMAEALDRSSQGVFVLDAAGVIRHLNRAGETLLATNAGLRVENGRLIASRADAAACLSALIGAAVLGSAEARSGSLILEGVEGRAPLNVTVGPLADGVTSVFHRGPKVIVMVSDPGAEARLSQTRLRALYDLTPAESKIALAMLDGATPRQAANRLGISANTARHQLHAVFAKTGVTRQAELVMLLLRDGSTTPLRESVKTTVGGK